MNKEINLPALDGTNYRVIVSRYDSVGNYEVEITEPYIDGHVEEYGTVDHFTLAADATEHRLNNEVAYRLSRIVKSLVGEYVGDSKENNGN